MDNRDQKTPSSQLTPGPSGYIELSAIHNFASKLCLPAILPRLKEYVRWQIQMRKDLEEGKSPQGLACLPNFAPISINLDLTTSCNFACDHCVDMNILNQKIRFDHEKLLESLRLMAQKGLKSVIVIGGGEPTLYPKFQEVIRVIKDLGLQVAMVSNGSGNKKIAEIADVLDENDWVRLSLDAGSNEVFHAMHHPRKAITLDEICEVVSQIKATKTRFKLGFSFVITWKGVSINDANIVENIGEIVLAAERARKYQFDYIAFKPFLTRSLTNNAEIVDLKASQEHFARIICIIRERVNEAQKLETPTFRVYATTNLKVLLNNSAHNYMHQPHQCHMQFFRQVLSPLGLFNCPAYRNQNHARLGDQRAYTDEAHCDQTLQRTKELIMTFDATYQCQEVTCLYNHVNWWLEDIIHHPEKLDSIQPTSDSEPDYFL